MWSRICAFVVTHDDVIQLNKDRAGYKYLNIRHIHCSPPLAAVCRLLRAETLKQYYKNTTFYSIFAAKGSSYVTDKSAKIRKVVRHPHFKLLKQFDFLGNASKFPEVQRLL